MCHVPRNYTFSTLLHSKCERKRRNYAPSNINEKHEREKNYILRSIRRCALQRTNESTD